MGTKIKPAIMCDFQRPGVRQTIHVKENDHATRFVVVELFDGGEPISVSASATCVVKYAKPDNTSGVYDTIGSRPAAVFSESYHKVTVELAPNILIGFGLVRVDLSFVAQDEILSTFTFNVQVERSVTDGTTADDYFSYRALDELYAEIDSANENATAALSAVDGLDARVSILESIQRPESWADVQKIVRAGLAHRYFEIGDQLQCQRAGQTLTWDIIGFDHDAPTDPQHSHSMTLQLHDCITVPDSASTTGYRTTFEFDAAEPHNPDQDVKDYGSNDWETSNIRAWLNADGSAGNWWQNSTFFDVSPSYENVDGFLRGLDADFLSAIGNVQKLTRYYGGGSRTTSDKVFVPTRPEVNGTETGAAGTDGTPYEYYDTGTKTNVATPARSKRASGAASTWMLRSPDGQTQKSIKFVAQDGATGGANHANVRLGVSPCVCIV